MVSKMVKWLDTEQAAEFLKCSKSTVYRLCKRGELDFNKKSYGLRISTQSLEAYMKRDRIKARVERRFLLTAPLKVDSYSFTEETRELFSKIYHKRLSPEEAEEIVRNFSKLMELLKDLDQKGV